MSKVKVTYFDVRGRGEIIRLVLKASKVEFEDVRIKREDWPALKPNTPSGQLPVVEFGEHKLIQSMAIARYIAKKHGLMGKDEKEYYLIERAIGQMTDILEEIYKHFHASGENKEQLRKEFIDKTGRDRLKVLEGFIKETGFFVGDTITLAELVFITLSDHLPDFRELYDDFPKLKELRDRILMANNDIDEWVSNRHVTII